MWASSMPCIPGRFVRPAGTSGGTSAHCCVTSSSTSPLSACSPPGLPSPRRTEPSQLAPSRRRPTGPCTSRARPSCASTHALVGGPRGAFSPSSPAKTALPATARIAPPSSSTSSLAYTNAPRAAAADRAPPRASPGASVLGTATSPGSAASKVPVLSSPSPTAPCPARPPARPPTRPPPCALGAPQHAARSPPKASLWPVAARRSRSSTPRMRRARRARRPRSSPDSPGCDRAPARTRRLSRRDPLRRAARGPPIARCECGLYPVQQRKTLRRTASLVPCAWPSAAAARLRP